MKYHFTAKSKTFIILAILVVLAFGIYLNRSYAYIYRKIGEAGQMPINSEKEYIISNNIMATSSLTYAALGDSLTTGVGVSDEAEALPNLLAQRLSGADKKIILTNYSVPGYKTADLINELLPEAIVANPDIVTLLIGVNDIHNQVSVTDFKNNYEQILSRLKEGTKARVYVVNIPFIGADKLMLPPYQYYFDGQTKEFNTVIKDLAVKYQVSYIDLYTPTVNLFKKTGDHYSADLFHPSASGYKIWADIIYDSIHN